MDKQTRINNRKDRTAIMINLLKNYEVNKEGSDYILRVHVGERTYKRVIKAVSQYDKLTGAQQAQLVESYLKGVAEAIIEGF